jgi:hypothetical protein
MKRKESKCRALSLLIGALVGLCCGSVLAVDPSPWVEYTPKVEANQVSATYTTVNFGGHQWIVVGKQDSTGEKGTTWDSDHYVGGSGIESPDGTLTLLLKDLDQGDGFDDTRFRASDNTDYTSYRSDYQNSDLQKAMVDAAKTILDSSPKEFAVIAPRTLTESADDISYSSSNSDVVLDQRFWALSRDEWYQLTSTKARAYARSSAWWLRSPSSGHYAILGLPGGAD